MYGTYLMLDEQQTVALHGCEIMLLAQSAVEHHYGQHTYVADAWPEGKLWRKCVLRLKGAVYRLNLLLLELFAL